jgi:hypothetical protein
VLKAALTKHGERWQIVEADMAPSISYRAYDEPTVFAAHRFEQFRALLSSQMVLALGANNSTSEILDRYFSSRIPFEHKLTKRTEFLDAFVLT